MSTIALLTKGFSGGVTELGRAIKESGHESVVFLVNSYEENFKKTSLFNEIIGISADDIYSSDKLEKIFANRFSGDLPSAVICCYDPFGPAYCSIISKYYKMGSEAASLMNCYLKAEMRKILFKTKTDTLPFYEIRTSSDLDNIEKDKWILKPSFGTSSEFVSPPLTNLKEIKKYYEDSIKKGRENIKDHYGEIYLLEKYVDGPEYSVEGIKKDDQIIIAGIFQKHGMQIINNIKFEGINFTPIADLDREKPLKDLVCKTVTDVGLNSSAFHIELRWDNKENRPHVVDINPRLPGGLLSVIHRKRHKIDLAKCLINLRLGLELPLSDEKSSQDFYGNLPIPATKKGVYDGYTLPPSLINIKNECKLSIIEHLPHGLSINPGQSEVYFASGEIITKTKEDFWWVVKECEKITPIIRK